MITLTCTHCQAVLNIDDAFAGGVCRCQHCGTIQTVPSRLKAGGKSSKSPRSLVRGSAQTGSDTSLDQLAEVVVSSGISSHMSGMQMAAQRRSLESAAAATAAKRRRTFMIAGAAAGAAVLIVILVVVFSGSKSGPAGPSAGPGGTGDAAAANFLSVPLTETSTVFVIDRGSSTREGFGLIKDALVKSVERLGPQRSFLVIFWDTGQGALSLPAGSLQLASPDNVDRLRKSLEEVFAFGQSDAMPALQAALAIRPDAVVLLTGKGWDMPQDLVEKVKALRGSGSTRVHTISIGSPGQNRALEDLANETGGQYKEITQSQLRNL